MSEQTKQRVEVHYSGHVQGVGFRYTVRALARQFAVTGSVRNLPDGRVQLVAEGAPEEVRRFLDTIAAEMGRYITDSQVTTGPATARFQSFDIRF